VAWAGDPAAIVRLSAQFRAPVFLGEEIVAGGRIREIDYVESSVVLETWVTVERDGRTEWPVKKGEATVRLGEDPGAG
jgi:acyl dehydratase